MVQLKQSMGHSEDGWKDDLDFLYLDVTLSGDPLKNLFLDEEQKLYGYDLDNADWDAMQIPYRIMIDRHTHELVEVETDINHGNNSSTSSQIQDMVFLSIGFKAQDTDKEYLFRLTPIYKYKGEGVELYDEDRSGSLRLHI